MLKAMHEAQLLDAIDTNHRFGVEDLYNSPHGSFPGNLDEFTPLGMY